MIAGPVPPEGSTVTRIRHVITTGLALLLAPCTEPAGAQHVVQHREPAGPPVVLTETVVIPAEEAGYTLVLPERRGAKGLMVFFNSDRDTGSTILREALPRDLAVMSVTTGNRLDFLFDTAGMLKLEGYIDEALTRFEIPRANLLYAGMSLAGTRAVRMALFASSDRSRARLRPRCIAVCDAPLDFVRFWHEMDRARRIRATDVTGDEGSWVAGHLERNLGGTAPDRRESYRSFSPYVFPSPDTSKLRALAEVRFRAYTEPDVEWWMSTRKKDYYGMNAVDMAAIVNELAILGNVHAELVITSGRGVLPDGRRHPHSWSIVDEPGLVRWFERAIESE